jgi:hypothetical protein
MDQGRSWMTTVRATGGHHGGVLLDILYNQVVRSQPRELLVNAETAREAIRSRLIAVGSGAVDAGVPERRALFVALRFQNGGSVQNLQSA